MVSRSAKETEAFLPSRAIGISCSSFSNGGQVSGSVNPVLLSTRLRRLDQPEGVTTVPIEIFLRDLSSTRPDARKPLVTALRRVADWPMT
ncbi:hypothetical protein D3C72_2414060 [compost metagenome]